MKAPILLAIASLSTSTALAGCGHAVTKA